MSLTKITTNVIDNSVFQSTLSSEGFPVLTTDKVSHKSTLDVDPSGELTTPENGIVYVAVRPSHPDATDDVNVFRETHSGDSSLQVRTPYFKSVGGAERYLRKYVGYSVVIYVDEDCQEYIPSVQGVSETGLSWKYVKHSELSQTLKDQGLKSGIYVWSNTLGQIPQGRVFNPVAVRTNYANFTIRGRFQDTGNGHYITTKPFNQAPPNIVSNVYWCTSTTLTPYDLGTDASVWTNVPSSGTTVAYVLNLGNIGGACQVFNVTISQDTNSRSAAQPLGAYSYNRMDHGNVTLHMPGKGYYYGPVFALGSATTSTMITNGDPENKPVYFPGWSCAYVGRDDARSTILSRLNYIADITSYGGITNPDERTWGKSNLSHGATIFKNNINIPNRYLFTFENSRISSVFYMMSDGANITSSTTWTNSQLTNGNQGFTILNNAAQERYVKSYVRFASYGHQSNDAQLRPWTWEGESEQPGVPYKMYLQEPAEGATTDYWGATTYNLTTKVLTFPSVALDQHIYEFTMNSSTSYSKEISYTTTPYNFADWYTLQAPEGSQAYTLNYFEAPASTLE
jgi:hypothetical protein